MIESIQRTEAWAFGAALTGLFDWEALSAVLLFLTLILTIQIALAQARNELRREAARVLAVATLVETARRCLGAAQISLKHGRLDDVDAHLATAGKACANFDLANAPTVEAAQALDDTRWSLVQIGTLTQPARKAPKLLPVLEGALSDYDTRLLQWRNVLVDQAAQRRAAAFKFWPRWRDAKAPPLPPLTHIRMASDIAADEG